MKTKKQLGVVSQFLCMLLRHKPQAANLDMDSEGWVLTSQLLENLKKSEKTSVTFEELQSIVDSDNKCRYSFKNENTFIRANQGHSLEWVTIDFTPYELTSPVYHGTTPDLIDVILKEGLKPQSRNYVHLSKDIETAKNVGRRYSKKKEPVVFVISPDATIDFFITDNGVVHAKNVSPEFLSVLKQ